MKEIEAAEQGICTQCEYLGEEELVCKAYPSGIPAEILRGAVVHKEILPDQYGDYIFSKKSS